MHKMLLGGKTPKDGASVVRAGFKAVGHREQPLEAAGVPISSHRCRRLRDCVVIAP